MPEQAIDLTEDQYQPDPRRFKGYSQTVKLKSDFIRLLWQGYSTTQASKELNLSSTKLAGLREHDGYFKEICEYYDALVVDSLEQTVLNAAQDDPKLALQVLERRRPGKWGKAAKNAPQPAVHEASYAMVPEPIKDEEIKP